MQKCWETAQKNIFSEPISLIGRMTQENLNSVGKDYRKNQVSSNTRRNNKALLSGVKL